MPFFIEPYNFTGLSPDLYTHKQKHLKQCLLG